MTISLAISADHGGFSMKEELLPWLNEQDYDVFDLGATEFNPDDDYTDFAQAVCLKITSGDVKRGIIICGSGVGACVTANKFKGVRASVCHDTYSARQGVEHDDLNVLCLGARVIGLELAREIITAFLKASFSQKERYLRRLKKITALENVATGIKD